MSRLLLRRADCIHTCDDVHQVIRDGYVLIEDGRIAALGPEPAPPLSADEEISVAGCLVTPGLVNIHHHLYQTLTRAVPLATRSNILEWLYAMYPIWAEIDADAYYWAALATSCELLASGCTTNADFAYLMPETNGEMAAEEIRGVREAGIRFVLTRGGMPTIEADLESRLRPVMGAQLERLLDREETLFPKLESTLRRYHDTSPGAMLQVAVGPTSVTYSRPQFMRRFADLARASACGLHVHFDPRPDERAIMRDRGGRRTVWMRGEGLRRPHPAHEHLVPTAPPKPTEGLVDDDPHQPSRELRCIAKAADRAIRLQVSLLQGVFGLGVVFQDAPRRATQDAIVLPHQQRERRLVAG